jgi:tRNA G18 (ribose-2'-O)-methylase SpoU
MIPVVRRIEVVDVADPRVDDFRSLATADRRPDRPGGRGLVIAEGVVVVERLLVSQYPVRALLGLPGRLDRIESSLAQRDVPAYAVEPDVLAGIVGFPAHRGLLAVADRAPQPPLRRIVAAAHRLAVLEGVGDHENLGALFRNAAALGIEGVLLGPGCPDPLYRRSVRVSMGHVLGLPFARLGNWPEDVKLLKDSGFRVVALTPAATAPPVKEADLRHGRVAILVGSEAAGLSEQAMTAADTTVRIPMANGVDSLNVATAAAIAFHEIAGR